MRTACPRPRVDMAGSSTPSGECGTTRASECPSFETQTLGTPLPQARVFEQEVDAAQPLSSLDSGKKSRWCGVCSSRSMQPLTKRARRWNAHLLIHGLPFVGCMLAASGRGAIGGMHTTMHCPFHGRAVLHYLLKTLSPPFSTPRRSRRPTVRNTPQCGHFKAR